MALGAKVALITGAAAGIGLATGRRLQGAGFAVVANDIDPVALARAWSDAPPEQTMQAVADVARPDQVDSMVVNLLARFGRLDVIVNNAALHGQAWNRPCLEVTHDEWRQLFDVNVFGAVNVVRAALPSLAASHGVVVNMSSMVGYGASTGSPYSVSKAAINGLTNALAKELGVHGIRAVGVAPGFIATPVVAGMLSEQRQSAIFNSQTIDAHGQPEDIASVIEFLVSPAARMITAHTVIADAGITRRP